MYNFTLRLAVLILFILSIIGETKTQGLHFSYIEFAPQSINPGLIGGFAGTYRASGIYRSQWNGGGVSGYKSFELGIDMPILRGFRKQDWIGVGLSLDIDRRGAAALQDRYARVGASYHFSFDKKQTNILTLGFQMKSITRSLNMKSDYWNESNITGHNIVNGGDGYSDPDILKLRNRAKDGKLSESANDMAIGLVFTQKGKSSGIRLGVTGTSFLKPALSLYPSGRDTSFKFNMIGFASFFNQINKRVSIEPMAFFQNNSYGKEIMINAKIGYQLNKDKPDVVKAGLGFRTGTSAVIFYTGGKIKGIDVGLSFDLPISGFANAPGFQNAFEIGASYVGFVKKKPKASPIIICPRL